MPSYHSVFNKREYDKLCDIPMIDFQKDKTPTLDYNLLKVQEDQIQVDIIDEAIIYFRANILFKNFSIDGPADKLIVYITVFIQKCLERGAQKGKDPKKDIKDLVDECKYTTDPEYFFNILTTNEPSQVSALEKYLKSIREEVVKRLIHLLYDNPTTAIDLKYWLGLGKKKFMGYDMLPKK